GSYPRGFAPTGAGSKSSNLIPRPFMPAPPHTQVRRGGQLCLLLPCCLLFAYPSLPSYCSLICATTAGSSSVVVSPSTRPSAISRSSRRMILAERVLGSSVVK